jgi:hypothetical protein
VSYKRKKYLVLFWVLISFIGEPVIAQTSSYGDLQGAYLFNFAKYINWPEVPKTFVIGVYGESEITRELKILLKGKRVRGLEIEVREVDLVDSLAECQLIYIPSISSKKISSIKKAVEGRSVLIVSEDDLIQKGAVISFFVNDDRLCFKLSKKALSETRLVASEGLLKLAILL